MSEISSKTREKLFRGKPTDGRGWEHGYYCRFKDIYGGKASHRIYSPLAEKEVDGVYPDSSIEWREVDPDTVGQYVGQSDINGIGIYEGDILEFGFPEIGGSTQRAVIYYSDECHAFCMLPITHNFKYVKMERGKVVGNIWDTPELLEANYEAR